MDRLISLVTRTNRILETGAMWAIVGLMTILIIGGAIEIIGRSLFGIGHTWTEELLITGVLWFTFLAAAHVTRRRSHITIDLVYIKLPEKVKRFADVAINLISLATLVPIAVFLFMYVLWLKQMGQVFESTLHTPHWVPTLAVAVGVGMCALAALESGLISIIKLRGDTSHAHDGLVKLYGHGGD